jgi:hypothetical protein
VQAILHSTTRSTQHDLLKSLRSRSDERKLCASSDIQTAVAILQQQAYLATQAAGSNVQSTELKAALEIADRLLDALPEATDVDVSDNAVLNSLVDANAACLDLLLSRSTLSAKERESAEAVFEVRVRAACIGVVVAAVRCTKQPCMYTQPLQY